jgi:hypothetical protein
LLASNDGDERDVYQSEVLVADSELELSHGLDERSRLDVTDGTTKLWMSCDQYYQRCNTHLDDTDIWLLSCLVYWHL